MAHELEMAVARAKAADSEGRQLRGHISSSDEVKSQNLGKMEIELEAARQQLATSSSKIKDLSTTTTTATTTTYTTYPPSPPAPLQRDLEKMEIELEAARQQLATSSSKIKDLSTTISKLTEALKDGVRQAEDFAPEAGRQAMLAAAGMIKGLRSK
eukprot:gene28192-31288_t